uniref:TRAP transporter large permease protein n=1 Tax=Alloyangia mangrovi TaxID=1779329 RepID=A0A2A3JZC4_9RHOB
MSSLLIGGIGVAALFGGILLGINVMVVLGLVGAFGLASLVGFKAATAILGTVFFDTTHSFHFSVIPLFLLMGFFAMRAGLGEDLFEATTKWLGNLRGGLAISTTLGAAAFGAASGSSVGTATVFTKLALPQMLDRGYDKSLASASIAIAGTLAVMIPPSALVVVYGILTDSSIGALLIAGFIPGIVFALVLCLAIWLTVLRNPALAPQENYSFTLREKIASLKLAGPLVLIILLIVVGLYVGIFTPTEAGGIGAFATFLMAIVRHRGFKGVELRKTLLETIQTTAMIFGILICALVFSKFLALSGVANAVGGYLTGLDVNRWVIVLLVSLIYLALGMMMDAPALLAITLPITHPVMMNLGFDPIWFGIIIVMTVELGLITPPIGMNVFVINSIARHVGLGTIFRGVLPFVLVDLVRLAILILVPGLVLFLPNSM